MLGVRPEAFEDPAFAPADLPTIEVVVEVLEDLGSDAHVFFRVDAHRIAAEVLEARRGRDALSRIGARSSTRGSMRERPRASATRSTRRRPSRLHFFDPDTGASLLPRGRATASLHVRCLA